MKRKLHELAEIQIGYQARGRIDPDPDGTHCIIQIKDFDDNSLLSTKMIYPFAPEREPERYLVTEGDVLFLSRGRYNFAYAIQQPLENTVAASYFYILRPVTEELLPEYLAWYLNQPPVQRFLQSRAEGTQIPFIRKAVFERVPVDVPPMATQQSICKLDRLMQQEQELAEKLAKKRQQLVQAACLQAAKGHQPKKKESSDDRTSYPDRD